MAHNALPASKVLLEGKREKHSDTLPKKCPTTIKTIATSVVGWGWWRGSVGGPYCTRTRGHKQPQLTISPCNHAPAKT